MVQPQATTFMIVEEEDFMMRKKNLVYQEKFVYFFGHKICECTLTGIIFSVADCTV